MEKRELISEKTNRDRLLDNLPLSHKSVDVKKKKLIYTIKDMKIKANHNGGDCLSSEYKGRHYKLLWRCSGGHEWFATPGSIFNGKTWCPHCRINLSEERCRYVFEKLTNHKFPSNKTILGGRKELDGYCKELNLAFEFQGRQHYMFVKHFHKTEQDFKKQKEKDFNKKELCKSLGIKLIQIPYWIFEKNIEIEWVSKILKKLSYKIEDKFSYDDFVIVSMLKKCEELAKSKKGKLITKFYLNNNTKMEWECKKRHRWKASWNRIGHGQWCPYCSGYMKRPIKEIEIMAKEKDIILLSKDHIPGNKLTWQCKNGHIWESPDYSIKTGHLCPYCAGNARKTIEEMREIAESRGGKCLSDKYTNCKQKMEWECVYGHKWEATPDSIINGKVWCPECKKKIIGLKNSIYSINDIVKIADSLSVIFLGNNYLNNYTFYDWKCKKCGHTWNTSLHNLKRRGGCNKCLRGFNGRR
jgi:hypothetical protein